MSLHESAAGGSERTRRTIIEATVRMLAEHGTAATLRDVAEASGISKSGLLHHFPDKENLIWHVVVDFLDRFRAEVLSRVDLSENRPGKLLRAYLRTLCDPSPEALSDYHSFAAMCDSLNETDAVAEVIDRDNEQWREQWREQLLADGLDLETVLVVKYAAEGLATASSYDEFVRSEGMRRALPTLLALTEKNAP